MFEFEDVLEKIDLMQVRIRRLRPLKPSELAQLKAYYRVGLTYASNALEGNSLTETETKVVLEDGLTIGGKSLHDHDEALGHAEAFDYMQSLSGQNGFSEADILALHRLFFHRIDGEQAGHYRDVRVFISGSETVFPAAENVPSLMSDFARDYAVSSEHPVVHAARVHQRFVDIHPFVDGNGRTARLLMNILLIQAGYPITIIPPILRTAYLSALESARLSQSMNFVYLIEQMVLEGQKEWLRLLGEA